MTSAKTSGTPHADKASTSTQDNSLDHEQLTSLISSIADGVLAVDRFTNIVVYNGAALNILDLNQSVKGKPLDSILELLDANNQPVDVIAYVRSIKRVTVNESLKLKYGDGSIINLYISVSPVNSGFGKARQSGYVLVLRDITREKSLEEERDEFISVVSHELRTPIAITEGNIGNAQFIAEKTGDIEQIKHALNEAHEQVVFLASMINDLSTLSRAERGKLVADIEQINVHELVQELTEDYQKQAEKKQLKLSSHLDPKLELLSSSKLYVREVLQNFITNAIKYTEEGGVTVSAKPHEDGVLFSVKDTGIGISRSDQEKVFDKFFRSEDFRTRQNNGTGLGLYITMKLARILHADINLTSRLDHGSTFTIYIPNISV